MASKAPESNSASRPMIDEDTFTPPLPPDRNCKDQSERSSDEKCSGPKGLAPQNEKLVSSPASVKSPVDNAESKGMKDPMWKIPLLPSRPSLTSNSTKAHTHSEEQKIKQEDKQNSLQQQSHNEKNSNGAEISSRKRPYSTGDMGNTLEALKAEETALPKELTVKFGPLKCDLCSVSVNSTVQARMHYTGKQHDKKVNQFLANWSRETGQPIPKRIKEGTSAKKVALDPKDMYCTVCDLPLTSVQHAQQHYMGKNHLKATQAKDRDGGKWQQKPQGDPAGGSVGMPLSTDPLGLKNLPDTTTSRKGRFYCELCQVVATSQDQLHMHLKGAKHRKAERAAGIGPKVPSLAGSNAVVSPTIPPAAAADSILASVTEDAASRKPGIKDYSIYRTPSGDYYCTLCTVICNREDVFHTHMISKKHAKHEKAKREREAAAQAATKGEKDSAKEFLSNLKKVISGNVEKVSNNLFFCKLCDLSVNSKEELEQHIATKEHMDKVGKADPYICHVCNMSLESEEHLKLHCTQEEHKKNLQLDVKA